MMHSNFKHNAAPKRFFMFLLFATAASLFFGAVVMLLWNAILPTILNAANIGYWQAVGLFVLCKILFSDLKPSSGSGKPSFGRTSYWKDKLSSMSDEEKIKFKEEWKKRCGHRKASSYTD